MDVAAIENDEVVNVMIFDESTYLGMKAILAISMPQWELIPLDECEKVEGGDQNSVWMGWRRNSEGKFYNPNWVPPEDPPEDPEDPPVDPDEPAGG